MNPVRLSTASHIGFLSPMRSITRPKSRTPNGRRYHSLIEQGESKTWRLRVNSDSILDLLPHRRAHALSVVAAFSECQHEGHLGFREPTAASMSLTVDEKTFVPSLVVRSNPVNINWDGEKWTVPANR